MTQSVPAGCSDAEMLLPLTQVTRQATAGCYLDGAVMDGARAPVLYMETHTMEMWGARTHQACPQHEAWGPCELLNSWSGMC